MRTFKLTTWEGIRYSSLELTFTQIHKNLHVVFHVILSIQVKPDQAPNPAKMSVSIQTTLLICFAYFELLQMNFMRILEHRVRNGWRKRQHSKRDDQICKNIFSLLEVILDFCKKELKAKQGDGNIFAKYIGKSETLTHTVVVYTDNVSPGFPTTRGITCIDKNIPRSLSFVLANNLKMLHIKMETRHVGLICFFPLWQHFNLKYC